MRVHRALTFDALHDRYVLLPKVLLEASLIFATELTVKASPSVDSEPTVGMLVIKPSHIFHFLDELGIFFIGVFLEQIVLNLIQSFLLLFALLLNIRLIH